MFYSSTSVFQTPTKPLRLQKQECFKKWLTWGWGIFRWFWRLAIKQMDGIWISRTWVDSGRVAVWPAMPTLKGRKKELPWRCGLTRTAISMSSGLDCKTPPQQRIKWRVIGQDCCHQLQIAHASAHMYSSENLHTHACSHRWKHAYTDTCTSHRYTYEKVNERVPQLIHWRLTSAEHLWKVVHKMETAG